MEKIKAMLDTIDINNLLKIFDIQIALGIFIVFFVFRSLFSKLIIKAYYTIIKSDKNTKESSMYKSLNIFFVLLGFWFAINILPISEQIRYYINLVLRIIGIYFIFKAISSQIHEESMLFKTIFKDPTNKTVNGFFCKIIRVFLWMIFFIIAINEIGYDLSGLSALVTGLGIRKCCNCFGCTRLSEKFT